MMLRIFLCFVLLGCSPAVNDVHETRFMMGTLVSFTVSDVGKEQAEQAIRAAAIEMQRVEDAFTIYGDADNDVKRFNRARVGQILPLNEEVAAVLRYALQVQAQSHGAFNPALAALNQLWGFSQTPMPTRPPLDADIHKLRQGLRHCLHHNKQGWWRDSPQCQLDFGGIAKGYAIDRGIQVLQAHAIQNAMIDAGGDVRVIGQHHGKAWRIGVRHPREPEKILGVLSLSGDVSVVTSGDYERFFIYRGKRYHHILNPDSGYPARISQSVTVLAGTAMQADAWSTALFVAGGKAMSEVEKLGMQALWVNQHGKVSQTHGLHLLVP